MSATTRPVLAVSRPRPPRIRWSQVILHIILILWAIGCVYPFIWMTFASLKPFKELVSSRDLLPHVWTLKNYAEIIQRVNFVSAFRNSVFVAVTVTLAQLLTSSAVGFIFAKYRFPGRELLFLLLLATMMVPFAVVMVPLYITVSRLRMVDQLSGIIVPGLWSTFGIFMMRQFMEGIPNELIDAARIDGASEWRIFYTLIVPMAASPMGALAVFTFLGSWDGLLWPLIILTSPQKQTLPIVLAGLRSLYWSRYDMWAAGSMLTVIPVMLVYGFASRHFIRGIAMTGLKA